MTTNIQRRRDVVTIYQGDYLPRIRHLEAQAEAAREADDGLPRLLHEGDPEYLKIAREHDALVKEAEATAVHFTLQAQGRKEWRALCDLHPPRREPDVDKDTAAKDAVVGVNEATFKEALVLASVIDPTDVTDETLDDLADADFDRLYFVAFSLNRSMVADPKASLVSQMTPKADETSS